MSFGCEVGVRKNMDRTAVLRHIPPNPHAIPQPDRRPRRRTDTVGSTYASGDALPSRRKPSSECVSIRGWQRGRAHTREQG